MNTVILCEGKTDAIIISYYLGKVHDWRHFRKKKDIINPVIKKNESIEYYKLDNNELLIYGVGGKDCFKQGIEKVLEFNKRTEEEKAFKKVIIVTDRDNSEQDASITNKLQEYFSDCDVSISLFNEKWTSFNYTDSFGTEFEIMVSPLIIPFDKKGALETFLLDSISEDIDKKYIVDESRNFVASINSDSFVNTARLKLKAELSVTFSVLSPETVFDFLEDIIIQVPWENYKTIQRGFRLFDDLIKES